MTLRKRTITIQGMIESAESKGMIVRLKNRRKCLIAYAAHHVMCFVAMCASLILMSSISWAAPEDVTVPVTISVVNNDTLGTTVVGNGAGATLTASPTLPDGVNANATGNIKTYSWSIKATRIQTTLNGQFVNAAESATVNGATNQASFNIATNFTQPGNYQVEIEANVSYWPGTGDKTYKGVGTSNLSQTVAKVEFQFAPSSVVPVNANSTRTVTATATAQLGVGVAGLLVNFATAVGSLSVSNGSTGADGSITTTLQISGSDPTATAGAFNFVAVVGSKAYNFQFYLIGGSY